MWGAGIGKGLWTIDWLIEQFAHMGIAVRSWSDGRYRPVSVAVDSTLQPRQESQALFLSAALHVRSAQICKCPSFSFRGPIFIRVTYCRSPRQFEAMVGRSYWTGVERELMQLANSQSEKIIVQTSWFDSINSLTWLTWTFDHFHSHFPPQ